MVFGRLVKRFFGDDQAAAINDDPFGRRTAHDASRQVEPPPSPPPPVRSAVVRRDEIIDERSRIAGYRFVARAADGCALSAGERATALASEHLATFARRRLALLPLAAGDWRQGDCAALIAAHSHFLVPAPAVRGDGDEAWLATLQEIREAGGRIAVDDAGLGVDGAAALAELIVLDFRSYALAGFERLVRRLRRLHPHAALAADGIGSWPEHRLCQSLGIRYSIGDFATAADAEEQTERLTQSRLVLIEMLNLLRGDAELAEISAVAKRDPAMAVKVVGMANSPVSGLSAPVASLDQAMLVLGRGNLYRWLSIAMFRAGDGGGRDETLLELALWRARFLEIVAADRPKQERDELFLVGLLSLVDNLLGQTMAQVVAQMKLPERVAEVLLESAGPYGRFLLLALAVERGRDVQAEKVAGALGLAPDSVEAAARAARHWTEEALAAA